MSMEEVLDGWILVGGFLMDLRLRKGIISVDVSFQWFSVNHMKLNKGNSYS